MPQRLCATATVTQPNYVLETWSVPPEVNVGSPVNVTARVTNTGDSGGTAVVEVRNETADRRIGASSKSIPPQSTETVTVPWRPKTREEGTAQVCIDLRPLDGTGGDQDCRTVTVLGPLCPENQIPIAGFCFTPDQLLLAGGGTLATLIALRFVFGGGD